MKMKLKLYIWTDFCPDYSDGLAFAIAEDETKATKLVEKEYGMKIRSWET